MFYTEQGKIISKLLESPEFWDFPEHDTPDEFYSIVWKHENYIRLWIANGMWWLDTYLTNKPKLGLVERLFLWPKVKKVIKNIEHRYGIKNTVNTYLI